ncbi:MAG TPA: S8 family serine peptidase, partial [Bellilinea sp.]|nr:S8 family serine peptidase [Bellilinea sp.]
MKFRIYRLTGIIAITLIAMLTGLRLPHPAAAQVIQPNPRVEQKLLDELQANGSADFVIEMAEQADLSAAYAISDWNERGQYVVDTLKATADRSQKGVRGQLERQGARYTAYFASNVVVVRGGSQRALEAVANLPEVARVRAPIMVRLEPVQSKILQPFRLTLPQASIQGVTDWGITDTGAPSFWSTFERQGEGIIVANIDSGVKYNHPALAQSYRCVAGNADDSRCWFNANPGVNCPIGVPCDDNGHGTHTMGTMVGNDDSVLTDNVGMAPSAQWIACRAFRGTEDAPDAALNACAEWILAPASNPANRPHVVNNSWGITGHNEWFRPIVRAWLAAGIFPVFSAGNSGSNSTCGNIGSPADYPEGLTVTAHDTLGQIAWFSSKGPNFYGEISFVKPNLSAPGVSIRSAYVN